MSVIQFPGRRPTSSVDDTVAEGPGEQAVCECGSAWFSIYDEDLDGTRIPGAVVLDTRGRVTGYCGIPRCIECGQAKAP